MTTVRSVRVDSMCFLLRDSVALVRLQAWTTADGRVLADVTVFHRDIGA
jgi:hypothetical protein